MKNLIEQIAVTAELLGTDLSEGAARVMVADLREFPESAVIDALKRCRREVRGRLTLAEIISRIDDGRPGVEEAWGMYPRDELSSAVVTDEMHEAMRHAWPILQSGDQVGARMAFKEAYTRIVTNHRTQGVAPKWQASLGQDPAGREAAVVEAVSAGRIGADHAMKMLPEDSHEKILAAAGHTDHPALEAPSEKHRENQLRLSDAIRQAMNGEADKL